MASEDERLDHSGPDTPSRPWIAIEDKRVDPSGSGYAFLVADIEWG